MNDTDELFTEEWYAGQFAAAVERKEDWAVYLAEQLDKQMRYWLNQPPILSQEALRGNTSRE